MNWRPIKAGVCASLVVATGGLSIPKIGASDFGYRLARQFGLNVVPTRPALVPLTFDEAQWQPFAALAGLSLEATVGGREKAQNRIPGRPAVHPPGLSGPGVLQISSYWHSGQPLTLNLAPGQRLGEQLQQAKRQSRKLLSNELGRLLLARLADTWCTGAVPAWTLMRWRDPPATYRTKPGAIGRQPSAMAHHAQRHRGLPQSRGDCRRVDTKELSQQTMESIKQPGLYFIGEVVDVTGWLGGYNFQWAWASAHACAQSLKARTIH